MLLINLRHRLRVGLAENRHHLLFPESPLLRWHFIGSFSPPGRDSLSRLEVLLSDLLRIIGEPRGYAPLQALRGGTPTTAHVFAARLLELARCRGVLTTNFDTLIEAASEAGRSEFPRASSEYDVAKWDRRRPALLKVHGSIDEHGDGKPRAEVSRVGAGLGPKFQEAISAALTGSTILVLSYSGRDHFTLMPPLFAEDIEHIHWINHVHPSAAASPASSIERWLLAFGRGTHLNANTTELLRALGSDRSGPGRRVRDTNSADRTGLSISCSEADVILARVAERLEHRHVYLNAPASDARLLVIRALGCVRVESEEPSNLYDEASAWRHLKAAQHFAELAADEFLTFLARVESWQGLAHFPSLWA